MLRNRLTRRRLLGYVATVGSALLAQACQPKVVEKVVKETVPVEKVVRETIIVQGTPKVVEKVVTPTAKPASKGPAIVRQSVWVEGFDYTIYVNIQKAFEKENPGISIQLEQYLTATGGGYYGKVQANFAADNSADLIYMQGHEFQPYANAGVLLPLDELIQRDNLKSLWPDNETGHQACEWKGHYYMGPSDSGGYAMGYNKDIFDKRKMPYPTDKWTWDQFKEAVAQLTFKEGDTKYYGFIAGAGFLMNWMHAMRKDGLLEWDRIIEPTKATWNQQSIIDELQWLGADIYSKGYTPLPADTAGGAVAFATGRGAMSIFGPWALSSLWGPIAKKEGGINYGMVRVPCGKTGKVEAMGQYNGHTIAKPSKVQDAAWKVMSFIRSEAGQRIISDGGRMAGVKKVLEEYWPSTVDKTFKCDNPKAFSSAAQEGRYVIIGDAGLNYYAVTAAGSPLNTAMEEMRSGKPAKEVIPNLNVQLQKLIDEYWKTHK